ncbi:MAG: GHKL domain-containing protein [Oscillospiraceae bacterium]|nr:GHKL domain-containing protein [Oscillospiraceae bacterium]
MFGKRTNRKIAEYQNELMSKHYDEVENIYKQMRGWKHDYHNHLQAIKAYISSGKIDELLGFCDRLEQDLKSVDTVMKTGNVMLDAILGSKLSLAKQRNIEVNAKASIPEKLQITDVDLCVLIGNLLDNAMEACKKTKDNADLEFDRPFIRIYIGMKGYHLYICVTNSVYGKIKKSGNRFLSTKNSPTHGFGLMRIDKVCEKYGGYCKRNSEPGVFSTEILLHAKEK